MHPKNDKTDADVETALKRVQQEHAVLDGPVTNRALLLAATHLGEVIRCAAAKTEYDAERMTCTWTDLENDLLSEIRDGSKPTPNGCTGYHARSPKTPI